MNCRFISEEYSAIKSEKVKTTYTKQTVQYSVLQVEDYFYLKSSNKVSYLSIT